METTPGRRFRAGESIEDFCRACKVDRMHTIVVTDESGRPLRVSCGYCHSEHNYRGGPRIAPSGSAPAAPFRKPNDAKRSGGEPFPVVSEREVAMSQSNGGDLEMMLRRVIREETYGTK